MKIRLLILFMSFFTLNLQAQNLSFKEIMALMKKDVFYAQEYLKSNGWKNAGPLLKDGYFIIQYYYPKGNTDVPEAFLVLRYYSFSDSKGVLPWSITVQAYDEAKYAEYFPEIERRKAKLISSELLEGQPLHTYKNSKYTFQVLLDSEEEWYFAISIADNALIRN